MPKRRTPTALKVVKGTFRNDRHNDGEPVPDVCIPSCPSHLSAVAKSEWRRISALLDDQGIISNFDRAALAAYCEIYSRWVKAVREIAKTGEVVETPNGSLQVSPWLSIARTAEREMRLFCSEFGLTPASRGRTVSSKKTSPKDSPADKKKSYFD